MTEKKVGFTNDKKAYVVWGGVFTDTTFMKLEGPEELYGPFYTYERALEEWNRRIRRDLDTCCHRVFIEPITGN